MTCLKNIIDFHFNCQMGMYFSESFTTANGRFLFSDLVEDTYWNYLTDFSMAGSSAVQALNESREIFDSRNRLPCIYLTPASSEYGNQLRAFSTMNKLYSDAWMVLEDFPKSSAAGIKEFDVKSVSTVSEKEEFLETFIGAYGGSDPVDPYANLSPKYVDALRRSINAQFGQYTVTNYVAYRMGIPLGVATAISKDNIAAVYNVGTRPEYRKTGVGRALMSQIAVDFVDLRQFDVLFLQTEHDSYVEQWYKSLGYETLFLGECYTV